MRRRYPLALLLSVVLFPAIVRASGGGAASCPIDVRDGAWTERGEVRLDYSEEYINQNEPKIGHRQATVGQIPARHDEIYTLSQTRRIGFEIGLTHRWSVQAALPFIHREHQHTDHDAGNALETWNFDGVGDLTLLNRIAVRRTADGRGATLAVIAGGVVPTGRDQVTTADGTRAEDVILPGKNAWSLILGASAARPVAVRTLTGRDADMPVFLSSTYQWNGRNPRDNYRIGGVWSANLGLAYPLLSRMALEQQFNLRINGKDDAGDTAEEIRNTGGTFVYYSPGVELMLADGLRSTVYVQVPVIQRVNGLQLTSDYNLLIGLSYRFSAL